MVSHVVLHTESEGIYWIVYTGVSKKGLKGHFVGVGLELTRTQHKASGQYGHSEQHGLHFRSTRRLDDGDVTAAGSGSGRSGSSSMRVTVVGDGAGRGSGSTHLLVFHLHLLGVQLLQGVLAEGHFRRRKRRPRAAGAHHREAAKTRRRR